MFLFLVLQLSVSITCSADSFDESPPAWEFILWGGKPTSEPTAVARSEGNGTESERPTNSVTDPPRKPDRESTDSTAGEDETSQRTIALKPRMADSKSATVAVGALGDVRPEPSLAQLRVLAPKNIPPLYVTPPMPGEGVWTSQGMPNDQDGRPIGFRTSYRPSTEYPNAVAHMLVLDMKRLTMNLYIGSTEPWAGMAASSVEPDLRNQMVCVTNALWKQKHSGEGGAVFRGKVLKPLAHGVATIVTYKDNSVDILEWNEGIPLSMVKDARQLRHLIVKDGKVVDSIIKAGKKSDSEIGLGFLLVEDQQQSAEQNWWGGYGGGQVNTYGADWFIATRSAFGIRPDGNLVFGIGHHISTKDLAKALVLAGCDRAIHADANPHNVVGNLYYFDPNGGTAKKAKLSPDQKNYTLDRYDRSYTSDFFGFFLRQGRNDS